LREIIMTDQVPDAGHPPIRQKMLLALKHRGSMTVAEMGELVGMSSMGARRHLDALVGEGWVRLDAVRHGQGRPIHSYRLAARAEELFPKKYALLANELLGYLAAERGSAIVEELFNRRGQNRLQAARARLAGLPPADRVVALAALLNSDGYLAELQKVEAGIFLITEHNCPICDVATGFRAACRSELGFLQAILPEAVITREQCLADGSQSCSYRIVVLEDAQG
jgi:predicted ArsR family transcriptional regulator